MKCGTVAVVGKANAGKSTLVNALVGEKISIVSPKPQTTRDRIYGVLTTDEYQIVFEDTPGVYKAAGLLNSRMQKTVDRTARDTDLILFALDWHDGIKEEDLNLLAKYTKIGAPVIAALTKTDITPKDSLPEKLVVLSNVEGVKEVIPVSARKRRNTSELLSTILKYLPESDYVFDPEAVSDKSEKFMIAEIMREKILLGYDKEIPHGVAVVVNKFEQRPNGIYDVDLDIVCEKANHKAIIIGKGGKALKETSTIARGAMERFLGAKVFLKTYVKVKENWRDSETLLKDYGYGFTDED